MPKWRATCDAKLSLTWPSVRCPRFLKKRKLGPLAGVSVKTLAKDRTSGRTGGRRATVTMSYVFEGLMEGHDFTLVHEQVRRLYDSMAETYDQVGPEPFYANQYRVYESHLAEHLPLVVGRVLDLG